MKSPIVVITLVAGMALGTGVANASTSKQTTKATKHTMTTKTGDSPAALQKEAKITEAQARDIAMKKFPGGKIESSELEREHGKLIYSFDIRTGKPGLEELQVSAIDGSIVSLVHETPAKEAAEKKLEAKEKAVKKH